MGIRAKHLLILLCTTAACAGGDDTDEPETQGETVAVTPRVEPVSDAQALGVLNAISASAAEAARSPARMLQTPELRRLVEVVRADHEALQAELTAIGDSLKLVPAEHQAVARVRAAGAAATIDTLQVEFGTADATVLQRQIELHTTLLAVLDSALIPGMQPSLLSEYTRAARPTIAAHLQRARQLELLLRQPRPATPAAPPPSTVPATEPARIDTMAPPIPPDTGRIQGRRQTD